MLSIVLCLLSVKFKLRSSDRHRPIMRYIAKCPSRSWPIEDRVAIINRTITRDYHSTIDANVCEYLIHFSCLKDAVESEQ